MKRWYIFFMLVGVLVALGSLGVFSGSLQQQTAGQAGPGKMLFLTMLAIGGLSYAAWLAYSSSARKRRSDAAKDAVERAPGAHHVETQPSSPPPDADWQPPSRDEGESSRDNPPR